MLLGAQRAAAPCAGIGHDRHTSVPGWARLSLIVRQRHAGNVERRRSALPRASARRSVQARAYVHEPREEAQHTTVQSFSPEFRRACDAQLRQLLLALRGCSDGAVQQGKFSIFVRVPQSLDRGDLSLQRVACRSSIEDPSDLYVFDDNATLVRLQQESTPEAEPIIEDWLNQQGRLELPHTEGQTVIYPLTFVPQHTTADGISADRVEGTLLGMLVWDVDPLSPPLAQQDPAVAQMSATLLEQACECLTMACALELRAALERAAAFASQQQARSLVEEARKPLSALRTFGAMLQHRVQKGRPEQDMASGIVVQGDQLHSVLQQLQRSLHPAEPEQLTSRGQLRQTQRHALDQHASEVSE